MKTYRLKENHSTMQKLDKLCELAAEMGISIQFSSGSGIAIVTDFSLNQEFELYDVDEPGYGMERSFTSFPFPTEYKLVYEK